MKKIILLLPLILVAVFIFAQTNIKININHKLDDISFQLDLEASSPSREIFKVTRLQYYISDISVVHDGMEEMIDDLVVLVDASQGDITEINLGDLDIKSIDAINLHIGVNPKVNHLDPSEYSTDHALAPKFPSMHWGWASGYRFVALEGICGNDFSQIFQLHALGDNNYFKTTIPITKKVEGENYVINLDANYIRLLNEMKIGSGLIVHGDNAEAKQLLKNINIEVFEEVSEVTRVSDFELNNMVEIAPNPLENGFTTIRLTSEIDANYDVVITNVLGEKVDQFQLSSNTSHSINITNSGLYFVNFIQDGNVLMSKKLISK